MFGLVDRRVDRPGGAGGIGQRLPVRRGPDLALTGSEVHVVEDHLRRAHHPQVTAAGPARCPGLGRGGPLGIRGGARGGRAGPLSAVRRGRRRRATLRSRAGREEAAWSTVGPQALTPAATTTRPDTRTSRRNVPCRVQWRLGTDAATVVAAVFCR